MTEKRFTCENNSVKGLFLKDNLTGKILEEESIGDYENACDELNRLHEENISQKRLLRVADEIIRQTAPVGIIKEWIKEMEELE